MGESSGSSGGVIGEGFGEGIFISSSESENLKQIKQLITKICQQCNEYVKFVNFVNFYKKVRCYSELTPEI